MYTPEPTMIGELSLINLRLKFSKSLGLKIRHDPHLKKINQTREPALYLKAAKLAVEKQCVALARPWCKFQKQHILLTTS